MTDITRAILDEHEWFRRRFADLDGVTDPDELGALWAVLAGHLEIHADAEEKIFYPELLRRGDDATDETTDAIGDHDEIRDAVRASVACEPGGDEWWTAVRDARKANSEHMGEEERGALADFRRNVKAERREELGRAFVVRLARHIHVSADLGRKGPSPEQYLEAHEKG